MIPSIDKRNQSVQIVDHRLTEVEQKDSPNQDDRPYGEISLIVVHGISLPPGEFGGDQVALLYNNTLDTADGRLSDLEGVKVSSHLFIRRDGQVMQFVAFDRRAWHAGISTFRGREQCNDFSIGIELEGSDKLAYEDVQYERLTQVCGLLMPHYGATDVVGHCHIAPGRKTDPGVAFSWNKLRRMLAAIL